MMNMAKATTAVVMKDAPIRRMNRNDKALLETSQWNGKADFKLEDKVSLPHAKAAFLQGIVVYVGEVHFAEGIWVGVQLTGPSIGQGDCDGVYKGKKYFANVGRNNGVLAPVNKVNKRYGVKTGDAKIDKLQRMRRTKEACMADMEFIDILVNERAMAVLKLNEERKKRGLGVFHKEEAHITRLKQMRLEEVMRSRGALPDASKTNAAPSSLKYSTPGSTLCDPDLELVEGLEMTQQNFCLSDPCLPDNPITFVSQAFLNMTGYHMNDILGKNCRFLQGKDTDHYHVNRIRMAIQEGSDCQVCLVNYRKNGKKFYNRLFMTALRDTKGRVKNYLGVQCEVSAEVAKRINDEEVAKAEQSLKGARMSATQELSSHYDASTRSVSTYDDGNEDDGFDVQSNTGALAPRRRKGANSHRTIREIPIVPYAGEEVETSDDEEQFNDFSHRAPLATPKKSKPRPHSGPSTPRSRSGQSPKSPNKQPRRRPEDTDATPPPMTPQRRTSLNSTRSKNSRSSSRDSDFTPPPRHPTSKGVPISIKAYLNGEEQEWHDEHAARLSL